MEFPKINLRFLLDHDDPGYTGSRKEALDMDQIKAAGLPTITPVIVTNEDEVGDVVVENNKLVIGA